MPSIKHIVSVSLVGVVSAVLSSRTVTARSFLPGVGIKGRAFVERLARGEFKRATKSFDATMSKALSPAKIEAIWRDLESKLGPFQRITNLRTESRGDHRFALVTCAFQRHSLDAKIVFAKSSKIAGLFFVPTRTTVQWTPPSYARPERFQESEVTVGNDPWKLPGTLTIPKGDGPFPAVVLVHGSGPNNRDESVGAIRVFKDIAWGLASRGIAVLRYDKRTLVHGHKLATTKAALTVNEETVDDAVTAVAMLRTQPRIDPRRVYLLGHSLGGMIAPRIGARAIDLAGLVILAGNTRPTPELVVEQITYLAKLDGTIDAAEEAEIRSAKSFRAAALSKKLRPSSRLELFGTSTPAAYWLDLQTYDPASAAARLPMPMFIGQGARDYQVTVRDFEGWKSALGQRSNVVCHLYPGLNHLLVSGQGRSTPEEYEKPGHVEAKLVADIARWIKQVGAVTRLTR